eukprot:4174077-Pyramimonas_sp.AAC.1
MLQPTRPEPAKRRMRPRCCSASRHQSGQDAARRARGHATRDGRDVSMEYIAAAPTPPAHGA